MITDTIKELRHSGKLDQAEDIVKEELTKAPENIWLKREYGWVCDGQIKQAIALNDCQKALHYINLIRELRFSSSESVLATLCWRINALLTSVKTSDQCIEVCNEVFDTIRTIEFDKQSAPYSIILKAFTQCKKWNRYIEFCDWWGLDNLKEKDFENFQLENGNKILSTAELAFTYYAKSIFESNDRNLMKERLPYITDIYNSHEDFIYVGYYIGNIYIALGQNNEDAQKILIPFVRKKQNDFWAWDLLAKLFMGEKRLACLLRAYTTKCKPVFLTKVAATILNIMLEQQKYDEARYVLDNFIKTKQLNNQKIASNYSNMLNSSWYIKASPKNPASLLPYKRITDEIIYYDLPEITVYVTYINKDKGIINFIYDKEKQGFGMTPAAKTLRYNSIVAIRCLGELRQDKPAKIVTVSEPTQQLSDTFYRKVSGSLQINEKGTFAFIKHNDDLYYIPTQMLKGYGRGDSIHIEAVWSYNKKKDNWGWKATKLIPQ